MHYSRQSAPALAPVGECATGDVHPVECDLGVVGDAALLQVLNHILGHEVNSLVRLRVCTAGSYRRASGE